MKNYAQISVEEIKHNNVVKFNTWILLKVECFDAN